MRAYASSRQSYVQFVACLFSVGLLATPPCIAVAQDGSSAIDRKLDTKALTYSGSDVQLDTVVEYLSSQFGLNIIIDKRCIAPAGADLSTNADWVTDGRIAYFNFIDTPLRDALSLILRPLGLAYSVEQSFIWISTPNHLRHEAFEDLETRYYMLPRREIPNVNADAKAEASPTIDTVELLRLVIPEIKKPVSGDALSFMHFDEQKSSLIVHNIPRNLNKIEALLELLHSDS